MPKVTVDGQEIEFRNGASAFHACAEAAGISTRIELTVPALREVIGTAALRVATQPEQAG